MLLHLVIAAATASEAPLKPKNIAISLSARWPATPLAAEAAEFMADEGLFYKFVEGMAKTTPATTDRAQLETIESVATNLLSPLGLRTLRAFLAAHVHSPRVEMWRQLSAAEATRLGVADPSSSWLSAAMFLALETKFSEVGIQPLSMLTCPSSIARVLEF